MATHSAMRHQAAKSFETIVGRASVGLEPGVAKQGADLLDHFDGRRLRILERVLEAQLAAT